MIQPNQKKKKTFFHLLHDLITDNYEFFEMIGTTNESENVSFGESSPKNTKNHIFEKKNAIQDIVIQCIHSF